MEAFYPQQNHYHPDEVCEVKHIKELGEQDDVKIVMIDKTNKICLINRELI